MVTANDLVCQAIFHAKLGTAFSLLQNGYQTSDLNKKELAKI